MYKCLKDYNTHIENVNNWSMIQKVAHLLDLKYEELLGFKAVKLRNNFQIIFLDRVEKFVSAV